MARRFVGSSSVYLKSLRSPITTTPFTIAGWVRPNLTAINGTNAGFMSIGASVSFARSRLAITGTVGNEVVSFFQSNQTANTDTVNSSTGLKNNQWAHFAGIAYSNSRRAVALNGNIVEGTLTTTGALTAYDRVVIGATESVNASEWVFTGDVAEVGVWNIALDGQELKQLAAGASPLTIRPGNLVAYWPLDGKIGSGEASLIFEPDYLTAFGEPKIVGDEFQQLRNKARIPKTGLPLPRNSPIYKIAPTWVADVKSKLWGTVAAGDNNSVPNTTATWDRLRSLLQKSANAGQAFDGQIISTLSSLVTNALYPVYMGGVLAPNGDIHFVPFAANRGQKIDASGVVSTYSLIATATAFAYCGGVLAPNGDIHFVPGGASVGQKINASGVVSTYSLVYTVADGLGDSGPYRGGVLAPNGDIHFVPYNSIVGQKVSASGTVSTYSLVYTTADSYQGGTLSPSGDVHFVPFQAPVGQKINPNGVVSTYSLAYTTSRGYVGGVIDLEGNIHFVPNNAAVGQKISRIGVISTYSLAYTGSRAYRGGVLAPNGDIHFIAYNAPVGQKVSRDGVVSTYSLIITQSGGLVDGENAPSFGGVLSPNGSVYCVPFNNSLARIQVVNVLPAIPFDSAVCESPFLNKL